MMLVGLPMDSNRVEEVHTILKTKEKVLLEQIQENDYVIEFNRKLQQTTCDKANTKLKKLVKPIEDFKDVIFNPSSHSQLATLLIDTLKLPILDKTKSGAPSTSSDKIRWYSVRKVI